MLNYPEIGAIHGAAVDAEPQARAIFVRGLAVTPANTLLVGLSPASIAVIDLGSGKLVELFQYSIRVGECIHGLMVWGD